MSKLGYLCCAYILVLVQESHAQVLHDSTLMIFFESGQFTPTGAETAKLLANLRSHRFAVQKISGHTDTVGSAGKNMRLSEKRSLAIAGLLMDSFHIPRAFPVMGFGKQHPVYPSNNAQNRRVDLLLQFQDSIPVLRDSFGYYVVKTYSFNKIYFVPNEPVIEASSLPYLDQVSEILHRYPEDHFEIRGHVNWPLWSVRGNDSGYRKKMDQLSTDRAKAVFDLLTDKGILPERMSFKGMGNTQMLYPNARSKEEQLENMRVEILVLKKSPSARGQ